MSTNISKNIRFNRMGGRIFVLAIAMSSVGASQLFSQQEKDIALFLKTVGRVQMHRSANKQWYLAKKGSRLHAGNIVQTGDNSLASIVFTDDKSLLKVRSKSRITIDGKRETNIVKKTILMRLGELWSRVTKGSFYRVETPSGVAAVKGTQFYVIYGEDGVMLTFCLDGLIELITSKGRLLLNPGEVGEMRRDGLPTKREYTQDELPTWANDETEEMLEIEFENDAGQKKKMNINLNRQKK